MIKIRATLEIPDQLLLNSISWWIKYNTPFTVYNKYRHKYGNRLKELILDHYFKYAHTQNTLLLETESDARKIFNFLFKK